MMKRKVMLDLTIGDVVAVNAILHHKYHNGRKTWERIILPEFYIAVVTGASTRFNGSVEWMDEGYVFTSDSSLQVWQTRRGLMNAEQLSLPQDILLLQVDSFKLPRRYVAWTEAEKEDLRDCMKNMTRDERGRWTWENE